VTESRAAVTPSAPPPSTPSPPAVTRWAAVAGIGAVFLVTLLAALWLHRDSTLYDTDSAYHLAAARAYAQGAVADHEFPPLRFSLLGEDGFGDKEWLFHRLLSVFTGGGGNPRDTLVRGRWALAFFEALIAAVIAGLSLRFLGLWGLVVPFGLFVGSLELAWRTVRLRPELLALALLLAAVWALGTRRPRLLGLLALAFTLAYTAFQALLGLVALVFLLRWWRDRRADWAALLYPALGVALGLVLHPQFPANLDVWAVQNLQFFRLRGALDVGTEIRPNLTEVALLANLGWWLGLLILARSTRSGAPATDEDRHLAEAWTVAAVAFGVLYLLMSRFSTYFVPFATLALLAEIRRRGLRIGRWTRLPGRGRLPLAVAGALVLLVSAPLVLRELDRYHTRTAADPEDLRLTSRDGLAAAIPEGAHVAADWGSTALYLLWAPQGSYLNALDPVFMAVPHPERLEVLEAILDGREPDVPLATRVVLDSDHLAFAPYKQSTLLLARLAADPRIEPRFRDNHHLYRFVPGANAGFVLDWKVVPPGTKLPVSRETDVDEWPDWPRAPEPELRALEGWVDADRVLPDSVDCLALVCDVEPVETAPDEQGGEWELAPHGSTAVWWDDRLLAAVRGNLHSVLGRGVVLVPDASPGHHRITVFTCRADAPGEQGARGRAGFFLLRRSAENRGDTGE